MKKLLWMLACLGVISLSNQQLCAFWCKSRCVRPGTTRSFYCCNYDREGRYENFINDPCDDIAGPSTSSTSSSSTSTSSTSTSTTSTSTTTSTTSPITTPTPSPETLTTSTASSITTPISAVPPTIILPVVVRCPDTPDPQVRNCVDELSTRASCTEDVECARGELCCPDRCLSIPRRICVQVLTI